MPAALTCLNVILPFCLSDLYKQIAAPLKAQVLWWTMIIFIVRKHVLKKYFQMTKEYSVESIKMK